MENVETKELVKVKSVSLLRELCKAKCLKYLKKVCPDKMDEQKRPIYIFFPSEKVLNVVDKFLVDTKIDGNIYDNYNADKWENCNNDEDFIKSRNYMVAEDIINDNELVFCLRHVRTNKDTGKKTFVIFKNDKTIDIKAKRDAESQAAWMKSLEANDNGR